MEKTIGSMIIISFFISIAIGINNMDVNKNHGFSITESVNNVFMNTQKRITTIKTKRIHKNKKVVPFVPLIPFISEHWNLPFNKASEIVHYAFKYGRKYHVSPLYVLSEIATESSFRYSAFSNMAAVGIMQVYPKEHWNYVLKHGYVGQRYYRLFRLKDNIKFGTYILAKDLKVFGSMQSASAHYFGICSFDKTYVKRVMNNYKLMRQHYY